MDRTTGSQVDDVEVNREKFERHAEFMTRFYHPDINRSKFSTADYVQFFLSDPGRRAELEDWTRVKTDKLNCSKRKEVAQKGHDGGIALFIKADDDRKQERLPQCLEQFNIALLHSSFDESGKLDTSKRFANRSAVLYDLHRYDEALQDIAHALRLGYPFPYKVWMRKAKIYLEQGNHMEALNCLQYIETKLIPSKSELEKVDEMRKSLTAKGKCEVSNGNGMSMSLDKDFNRRKFNRKVYYENPSFVYASTSISIDFDNERTRHVVALENIHAGDILFDEIPFASILLPDCFSDYCYHCHANLNGYFFPCQECSEVKFCSDACGLSSWTEYHSVECGNAALLRNVGLLELATRVVLTAGVDTIVTAVADHKELCSTSRLKDTIPFFEKKSSPDIDRVQSSMLPYLRIYSLNLHLDKMNPMDVFTYAKTAAAITFWLQEKTTFVAGRTPREIEIVGGAILRHLAQLISNAQRLYSFGLDEDGSILDDERIIIGSAIYASTSLMNHSCDPNISTNYKYARGEGRRLIVKATRPISAGEEVVNSYGVTYQRHEFDTRNSILRQQYYFTCQCVHCQSEKASGSSFSNKFESWHCFNTGCHRPLSCGVELLENQKIILCPSCSSPINLEKFENFLKETEEMLDAAQDSGGISGHALLEKRLALLQERLYNDHRLIAAAHDHLAKSLIRMGLPERSLPHLRESLNYATKRFGPTSNEYGFELRKYAEALEFAGIVRDKFQNVTTKELLRKALEILENYFPSTK